MKKTSTPKKGLSATLSTLGLLVLIAAVVAMGFALRGGYETYVRSTYELEHYDTVMTACSDFDVDPTLVYGIIRTESGFDEQAVSSADARGLMQVTAVALDWIQLRTDEFDSCTADDLFDPVTNIRCGVYLLSLLHEQFDSEEAVIASYNAGNGKVSEWLADPAYSADGVHLDTIPYEETREYVKRVQDSKAIYRYYYHIGDDQTTTTKGDS